MSITSYTSNFSLPIHAPKEANPYKSRCFSYTTDPDQEVYDPLNTSIEDYLNTAPSTYRSSNESSGDILQAQEALPAQKEIESICSDFHREEQEVSSGDKNARSSILAKRRRPSLSVNIDALAKGSTAMIFPTRNYPEIAGMPMLQDNYASRAGYCEFIKE